MKKGVFQMVNIWKLDKRTGAQLFLNPEDTRQEELRNIMRKSVDEKLTRSIVRDVGRLPRFINGLAKDEGYDR